MKTTLTLKMEFTNGLGRLQAIFSFPHTSHLKDQNNTFSSLTVEQKRPPEEELLRKARSHLPSMAPYCNDCVSKYEAFNVTCEQCYDNIFYQTTTISQLFAVARQWTPGVQSNMDVIIREILKRGAHPDDWDSVTGMYVRNAPLS